MSDEDVGEENQQQEQNISINDEQFYTKAEAFWSSVPATVDGVLGGFGCISYADIKGSDGFIKKIFRMKDKPGAIRALDCGAGIGRVTKNLLIRYFKRVDLVEQNPKFLEAAKTMLNSEPNIGEYFNSGLQNFTPQVNCYDVIWSQWVLGHLTNEDLVDFLIRCKFGLKKNGLIVIKENIACSEDVVEDDVDSSVTRPNHMFLDIFQKSGLSIIKQCKQTNFPKELFSVKLFALRPNVVTDEVSQI